MLPRKEKKEKGKRKGKRRGKEKEREKGREGRGKGDLGRALRRSRWSALDVYTRVAEYIFRDFDEILDEERRTSTGAPHIDPRNER